MKWVGSTKVQHLCWSGFVLSLTKEADRTDLKSKLLVLITKVIDHHVNYGHLVYFGRVDFQHRLCIALSWLLKKEGKNQNCYKSEHLTCVVDLHSLSLKCRIFKLFPYHAPDTANTKSCVFLWFYFKNVTWNVLILAGEWPIGFLLTKVGLPNKNNLRYLMFLRDFSVHVYSIL